MQRSLPLKIRLLLLLSLHVKLKSSDYIKPIYPQFVALKTFLKQVLTMVVPYCTYSHNIKYGLDIKIIKHPSNIIMKE
jgi:hypothetical protein